MEGADVMSAPVVRIRNLRLSRGERILLDEVTLDVQRGEVLALMGASGSGKTTLLRAVAGLETFDRGDVDVDGVSLSTGSPDATVLRALRAKVGMVFQFHCLFEHLTALENVCLAPVHVRRESPATARTRGLELLEQLGVAHRASALPRELSGGEAQRVAIARALATDPPVLLMDEPTASLDPERRAELAAILHALVERGRTLMVVTHDEDFAASAASRVVRVVGGRITTTMSDIDGRS
jgi:ABC-type polar amino acid transport system ATPase subunit